MLARLINSVAGVALIHFFLAEDLVAMTERLNLPPVAPYWFLVHLFANFATATAAVWPYAAVRPRLGPGLKSAALVAAAVWYLTFVTSSLGIGSMGMVPFRFLLITIVWGFFQMLLATSAVAWVCKEN